MEKFTQKWTICSLLEPKPEGYEFHFANSPLHITYGGVFATSKNGQELAEELSQVAASTPAFEVEAKEEALFGPDHNIPVMRVKKSPELMEFYSKIYNWLKEIGVVYNSPEYQGKGYEPHSTKQKSGSLKPGEKRIINSVSLIDMFPSGDGTMRKITKTIDFKV